MCTHNYMDCEWIELCQPFALHDHGEQGEDLASLPGHSAGAPQHYGLGTRLREEAVIPDSPRSPRSRYFYLTACVCISLPTLHHKWFSALSICQCLLLIICGGQLLHRIQMLIVTDHVTPLLILWLGSLKLQESASHFLHCVGPTAPMIEWNIEWNWNSDQSYCIFLHGCPWLPHMVHWC